MSASQRERLELQLALDFEALGVREFTSFLHGLRSLTLRFFIEYLHDAHYGLASFPYELPFPLDAPKDLKDAFWRAYCTLEQSYLTHYRKLRGHPGGRHGSFFDVADRPFHNLFDEEVFDDWANSFFSVDIEVYSPRNGSVLLPLSLAALMTLASVDYNYSVLKDVTLYVFERLKRAVRQSAPKDTVEHVPDIVRQIARDKRVRKMRLRVNENEFDLQVEWKSHP